MPAESTPKEDRVVGKGIIDVFSLVVIAGIIAVLALHPTVITNFFTGGSTLLGTALKG